MTRTRIFSLLLILSLLISPYVYPQETPDITKKEISKSLSDALREGRLTPEGLEMLKTMPEFKGLTPEEISKGKELLEKEKVKGEKETLFLPQKTVLEAEREVKSLFHRFRTQKGYQEIDTKLEPFGADFFKEAAVKVITERTDIPVPAKYVIGPGDEVKILLWGRVNAYYTLKVDRDGKITIPQIGPVTVAGMTFEEMSKKLIELSENIVGANIDVTLGSLRTIPIFVLGDVRRPGAYTIGAFATITDALLLAGGPNEIGSVRRIELRRQNKLHTVFDLYDLLLKGDKSKDVILQAGDIIFVPVVGPLVGVCGNVRRPAIYELKDRHDLETLIEMAGGILPTGYAQQVQVERIVRHERHVVIDLDATDSKKLKEFKLQDGDLVKIFNVVDRKGNVVFLYGNVKKPGQYEWKRGMRLKDLIGSVEELLQDTYLEYGLIKRIVLPEVKTVLFPFDLRKLLLENEDSANVYLEPLDEVYIFSKWMFVERPFCHVEGEVRKYKEKAGALSEKKETLKPLKLFFDEGATVYDVIHMAGGLTDEAYLEEAQIVRFNPETKEKMLIKFNLRKAMQKDPKENIPVAHNDLIRIHSYKEFEPPTFVSIEGDVLKPGKYPFIKGMTVRDLVVTAGNVLDSAYLEEGELISQIVKEDRIAHLERKIVNLRKALMGDPNHNIELRPYDHLSVKRITDFGEERYAYIYGEVLFPGKYKIKRGERLSSLIERAGGFKETAYLRGAVFTRESVKKLQKETLQEMILRIEREMLSESAQRIVGALSPEEVEARKAEVSYGQKLIESLKKIEPTGRMTIKISHLRLFKGSEFDIELENGDTLFIPPKNPVVNVIGSVMSQGSFIYREGYSHKDYIEMAGGLSRFADEKNIFILKVDGSAKKVGSSFLSWNFGKSRWEISRFSEEDKIEPGDTIVVPEKLERIAWLRNIKDITQILMNTAVVAGTLKYLFE